MVSASEQQFLGRQSADGGVRLASRALVAATRAVEAHHALTNCHLCARHCGVNRIAGERGFCQAGAEGRIFSAQVEVSDEMELIPTFAVAFSGCDLRCAFCITGRESWDAAAGNESQTLATARRATEAMANGARSIMILGGEPTVHLPFALDLVAGLPDTATLVWKTNAHASGEARRLLDGLFDVWIADYKFGNDGCAERLAQVPRYTEVARENLLWAAQRADLIVRHLVMPGHVMCCWQPVARWLAENMPRVKVNLRSGFWPAWNSRRHSEMAGTVSPREASFADAIARDYNLNRIT